MKENSDIKTTVGIVRIGKVSKVALPDITQKDAVAAGFKQLSDLLKRLSAIPVGDIYKIAVRYHAADPRISLREQTILTTEAFALLHKQLARLDQYSKQGAWTMKLLTTIQDHPKLKAADLAVKTGMEKDWLKLQVRKLKNLGLTVSHDPGYTISPLGAAFLSRL